MGNFDGHQSMVYKLKNSSNGVYAFVISGEVTVEGQLLHERDALGIWNTAALSMQTGAGAAEILLMEVPMTIS